jgi:hypothetical protein
MMLGFANFHASDIDSTSKKSRMRYCQHLFFIFVKLGMATYGFELIQSQAPKRARNGVIKREDKDGDNSHKHKKRKSI